jgi:hypothetical protein
MNTPGRRRSGRFDRKRAIVRRFIMLALYRFFSLCIVGIFPLVAHTLVSIQTEPASNRPWVAPELWLLSLVMWGSALAESLADDEGDARRAFMGWCGFFGAIGSAYAYASLMVHAPGAIYVNGLFQRYPVHAIVVALIVIAWFNYPVVSGKAIEDVDKGNYS